MDEPNDSGHGERDLFEQADSEGMAEEREAARVLASVESRIFGGMKTPAKIGRFTLIERIGEGGAGMVWAAYDPRLDRKVALKLLRARGGLATSATERLVREAQVAGRLSHPNIVSVFEVGEYESSAYLAMEYIDGPNLAGWLEDVEASEQGVIDVFTQAGRGLAEAHRNGVIHRDFKPANVMVQGTATGPRARVVDFGLAGWVDAMESEPGSVPSGPQSGGTLTRTGARLGTPAYMAPEQAAGEKADARSDQFSFCLSLVEGLIGRRPFETFGDYTLPVEALAKVPSWTRAALTRGLAIDPDARWPSMDALLAELSPPSRSGRRWAMLGVTGAVAVVAVGVAARPAATQDVACRGADAELAGVWDEPRRAEIGAAIMGSKVAYARGVSTRVASALDAWTTRWSAMHREACEATHLRKEQSSAVLDLRMSCLRRAKLGLSATTDVLAASTESVVEKADELVGALPRIEACEDIEGLLADVAPPSPDEAERVQEARALLAQAAARQGSGQLDLAEKAIGGAHAIADGLEYPPLRTELWLAAADVHTALGKPVEAEAEIRRAYENAARHGQWDSVRAATVLLMANLGVDQGRGVEALPMRELAIGLSRGSPLHEAEARATIGILVTGTGKYDEAEKELRTALELQRALLDEGHVDVAHTRAALATNLFRQGKVDEAEAEERGVLEARIAAMGTNHPSVASTYLNLGVYLHGRGKLDEAKAALIEGVASIDAATKKAHPTRARLYASLAAIAHMQGDFEQSEAQTRAALAVQVEILGPEDPGVASTRSNLAMILRQRGKLEEAEAEFLATLQLRKKTLGATHPDVARSHHNLGGFYQERQRFEDSERHLRAALEINLATFRKDHPTTASAHMALAGILSLREDTEGAEAEYRSAVAIRERELGADDAEVANAKGGLARTLQKQGRHEEAQVAFRSALRIREAKHGPDDPRLVLALLGLGDSLRVSGQRAEAVKVLRRAAKIIDTPGAKPRRRAKALFALAQGIWTDPAKRAEAREVAERAAGIYRELGAAGVEQVRLVESWLAEH